MSSAHEHDGSGCHNCDCSASPMNTFPCTCPSWARWEMERRNREEDIVQVPLQIAGGVHRVSEPIGEMSIKKDGRDVAVHIRIDERWSELVGNGDFAVSYYPTFSFPIRPKTVTDESHIIRGEN